MALAVRVAAAREALPSPSSVPCECRRWGQTGIFAAQVAPTLVAVLGQKLAAKRAGLISAQLLGLGLTRYLLRLPAVTALSPQEIENTLTPAIPYLRICWRPAPLPDATQLSQLSCDDRGVERGLLCPCGPQGGHHPLRPSRPCRGRVFHHGVFLCRAVSPQIAATSVSLKDLPAARNQRHGELRQQLVSRRSVVDILTHPVPAPTNANAPAADRNDAGGTGEAGPTAPTRSPPFVRNDEAPLLWAHLAVDPAPVSAHCPNLAGADAVIARCLAKSPENRFDTCGQFIDALADAACSLSNIAKMVVDARSPARPQ